MTSRVVAIAADHAGFELRRTLIDALREQGLEVLDFGTDSADSVDYPDMALLVTSALKDGRADFGVLVCGSGIGIGIAANRIPGIRAATCTDATMARLARAHNDANILALGARIIGPETARDTLIAFLATPFDGGPRHTRRIGKLG